MHATENAAVDDPLIALVGSDVASEVTPGVRYRMVSRLGHGGMSVVFYAQRITAEGQTPVVMKLLRPSFVAEAGPVAALSVKKEAIALGRLNERVPPTPFVVRFIDTGLVPITYAGSIVMVPWVVVEYVHGGAEGTTLSERVDHCILATGAAFDPGRAAHAVSCLTQGLVAVHEVGVIHRDLKPDNVLCCGFGDGEILKLADFGVARPVGIATFTDATVGTPGFTAPELSLGDSRAIGPWSDVFSLAAVIYFLLTGEDYLFARSPGEALVAALSPKRRSILDAKALSPELRRREHACRSIDAALAVATASKIEHRPHRAEEVAAMILPWLEGHSIRSPAVARRIEHIVGDTQDDDAPTWSGQFRWNSVRSSPETSPGVVRSVAWDGDGRAMAVTTKGLAFWNGSSWCSVSAAGVPEGAHVRFVQRRGPGQWLLGCDEGTFVRIGGEGPVERRTLPGAPLPRFDRISGDLDDLAVLVGTTADNVPVLCARSGGRWLKPLPLRDIAAVASIARVEDARFLVAGRGVDEGAFVGLYSPLDWHMERLGGPKVRAFLGCAGQMDRGMGLVTGAEGSVVLWTSTGVRCEVADAQHDLSAAGLDVVGRVFAGSAGRLWMRRAEGREGGARPLWECIWHDPAFAMPIVSIFADLAGVLAMTADGGVIEGRALRATLVD